MDVLLLSLSLNLQKHLAIGRVHMQIHRSSFSRSQCPALKAPSHWAAGVGAGAVRVLHALEPYVVWPRQAFTLSANNRC